MNREVENSFDCMNRVSDDNNLGDIIDVHSLIDTTSNGK